MKLKVPGLFSLRWRHENVLEYERAQPDSGVIADYAILFGCNHP